MTTILASRIFAIVATVGSTVLSVVALALWGSTGQQIPAPTVANTDPSAPFFATVRAMIDSDNTVWASENSTSTPTPVAVAKPKSSGVSRIGEPLSSQFPAGVLSHEAEIQAAGRALSIDPYAIASIMTAECPSGNAGCTSYVGAAGLMQVMPDTAVSIQGASGYPCVSSSYDPATSILCGSWYFRDGLRAAAALWSPESEVAMIGMAAMGYNAGNGKIPQYMPSASAAMGQEVCYITQIDETRRHCLNTTNAWLAAGRK